MEIEFRLGNFIVLQFRNLFLREEDDFFLCLLEFWPECLKLIVFMETFLKTPAQEPPQEFQMLFYGGVLHVLDIT